jgi:hypothetical protein
LPSASEKFLANLGKLVVKFEADKAHYLSKDYSEAQARIDFITPFFKVLGWDVENEAGDGREFARRRLEGEATTIVFFSVKSGRMWETLC